MKLHHVAALALMGSYLLMPPLKSDLRGNPDDVDLEAPLTEWKIEKSFDSAAECMEHISWQSAHVKELVRGAPGRKDHKELAKSFTKIFRKAADSAQCIASDDPRLKGN